MLVGCSTHNRSLAKQQNLNLSPVVSQVNVKDVLEMSEDVDARQFERIPFVKSNDVGPNYVHKLLVRLGNGQFRIIILEDNEDTGSLTTDFLHH